jgi:Cu+-exporting ATPase
LSLDEERAVFSVAVQSTHPLSARIAGSMRGRHVAEHVVAFLETPGCGIEGHVGGREIRLGSAAWILGGEPAGESSDGSAVHVMIGGVHRGFYPIKGALRPGSRDLLRALAAGHELALLSGDNERERARFTALFGPDAKVRFNQSPFDKLGFIDRLRQSGRTVMMVGDGLNDAGALRQSDVGVAVVEDIGVFSPASDVIMEAALVPKTHELLRYARTTVRIVRASFVVSTLYNVAGVAIAATGNLSPLVCAVLMPLSSVSVVVFACAMTGWAGQRAGLGPTREEQEPTRANAAQARTTEGKHP